MLTSFVADILLMIVDDPCSRACRGFRQRLRAPQFQLSTVLST